MNCLLLDIATSESFSTWSGWTFVAAVSTLIAAIAACLYTYFTYHLLAATKVSIDISNKLAEFQIYSKLGDLLASQKALDLFDLIEFDNLYIEEVMTEEEKSRPIPGGEPIKGKELRRFVLSPIEDLAKFRDDGLLSLDTIDSGFGNTILMVGNNEQVINYIKFLRSRLFYSENILYGFESLYKDILERCSPEEKLKYRDLFQ